MVFHLKGGVLMGRLTWFTMGCVSCIKSHFQQYTTIFRKGMHYRYTFTIFNIIRRRWVTVRRAIKIRYTQPCQANRVIHVCKITMMITEKWDRKVLSKNNIRWTRLNIRSWKTAVSCVYKGKTIPHQASHPMMAWTNMRPTYTQKCGVM